MYYNRIDLSEGIDVAESNNGKECIVRYNWFFNNSFKFQKSVSHRCLDLTMMCVNLNDIAITTFQSLNIRHYQI